MVGCCEKFSPDKKHCVVIGTTHLCVSILQLLQQYYWNILCVVSDDPIVKKYCKAHNINIIKDLCQVQGKDFVLFSVINYLILSKSFLESHRVKYALNYHDSFLPKYGGVNSTTWSIYNNEAFHGVSWHLISPNVDEGDLVKQVSFPISAEETAFSLNLKCSGEAIRLFELILKDFDSGFLNKIRQNLNDKTYFGKGEIPKNYGILNFKDSFEEIDRVSRSLYFGKEKYCNPVGTIKIWDGCNSYLFDNYNFVEDKKAVPGKVYSCTEHSILVGIRNGKLAINNIRTLEGIQVSAYSTNFYKNSVVPAYSITQKDREVLSGMKKSERILINKVFSSHSDQKLFFDSSLVDLDSDRYQQNISCNGLSFREILVKTFLGIIRFIDKDAYIPVKLGLNSESKFLNTFIYKMNLVKIGVAQKDLPYGDFASFVMGSLEESQLIPRDLAFRYHIDNPYNNLEIVCTETALPLGNQRLRVTVAKEHIYIDGYKQDKAIVDSIYSFIQYVVNDLKIDSRVRIKNYIVYDLSKEFVNGSSFNQSDALPANDKLINSGLPRKDPPNFLEAFEEQALLRPNATALIFEGKKLNYKSLNEKANQFARYLQEKGVQPKSLIGLGLDRSTELVTALLGIMKAGCTYIPIDPSYPFQRIHFILEDACVNYLVTKSTLGHLFDMRKNNLIFIDEESVQISQKQKNNLQRKVDDDHLAFVIYTSGSTGQPKGVEIFESSLDNLIHSVQKQMCFTSEDRWLALATISFDIAVMELWLPLSRGGSVVLVSEKDLSSPTEIIRLINNNHVTVVQATPSRLQMLVDTGWKGSQEITVISTGECLPERLANQLLNFNMCLWNGYGPTETTVWSSIEKVSVSKNGVTIGRPIDNTDFYILDDHKCIQPDGIPGELYIGGIGVARGYRNRPELTHQKFISSPFGRLYKTGDLVRRLEDGRFEYIRRLDRQVKVRGFRIELEEIEAVLKQVKGVSQVVVTTYEINPKDIRLVAYFQGEVQQTELENAAVSFLPSYMQPNIYVKVKAFPLTANQKIDRNALPCPIKTKDNDAYVMPQSAIEKKVASIFERHLGVEQVSADANFFSLGGHSILVVQVISEINKLFCIDLSVTSIFEYPTVRTLGMQIEAALDVGGSHEQVISRIRRNEFYSLSASQQRLWVSGQLAPSTSLYSVPQVLEVRGALNVKKFQAAIKAVFKRHEIFRTIFLEKDGEIKQMIKSTLKLPFEYCDYSLAKLPEANAWSMISIEAKKGFDLRKGPLLKFILIRISEQKHLFFFNLHHLIFDGISTNVLLEDICRVYTKKDVEAPQDPQYLDYLDWQIKGNNTSSRRDSIDFLKQKLQGIPLKPFLSHDKVRPKVLTYRGSCVSFLIRETYADKINSITRENNTTLFTFMLTTFHILLTRYSSQKEFVIGVPFSERDNSSLDSMIGCFVNAFPFPTFSKGDETFIELLRRFSNVRAELFKHQGVSLDNLVRELNIERSADYAPIFQVMLNMLPRLSVTGVDDLQFNLKQVDRGMSHYDLSMPVK